MTSEEWNVVSEEWILMLYRESTGSDLELLFTFTEPKWSYDDKLSCFERIVSEDWPDFALTKIVKGSPI